MYVDGNAWEAELGSHGLRKPLQRPLCWRTLRPPSLPAELLITCCDEKPIHLDIEFVRSQCHLGGTVEPERNKCAVEGDTQIKGAGRSFLLPRYS